MSASYPTHGLQSSMTPALPPYSPEPEMFPVSTSDAQTEAQTHATNVSFSAEESVVRIRQPRVRIQGSETGNGKENSGAESENPDIRTPSFMEFCDHPVVVVSWCVLMVANATALIVALSLLPVTHPK